MKDSLIFLVDGAEVRVEPEKMVAIGESLHTELMTVSKDFVRVGRYLAHMNSRRDLLKADYDSAKGKKYAEFRSGGYEALYAKKPTEEGLTHALNEDTDLLQLRKSLIEAGRVADELYALRTGLNMKMDVLREVSSHLRMEMKVAKEAH